MGCLRRAPVRITALIVPGDVKCLTKLRWSMARGARDDPIDLTKNGDKGDVLYGPN